MPYLTTADGTDLFTFDSEEIEIVELNSVIYTIMQELKSALSNIPTVESVTDNIQLWNNSQQKKYPRLYVSWRVTETERIAYPHDTAGDMEGTVEVTIQGEVWGTSETEGTANSLYQKAETEILGFTADGLADIFPLAVDNVYDTNDRFGLFLATYQLKYIYNHNTP